MSRPKGQFVSRGGDKLQAALDAFKLDVTGRLCADFGCNVGGFTDCLLQRGAEKVYAVDTGYGTLAWKLRRSDRVVVMERTNALYCEVPEPVDLVAIDAAWTPLKLIVPAAMRWLKSPAGRVVALLKPHYELAHAQRQKPRAPLPDQRAREVCDDVCRQLSRLGPHPEKVIPSPIKGKGGNTEFLVLL